MEKKLDKVRVIVALVFVAILVGVLAYSGVSAYNKNTEQVEQTVENMKHVTVNVDGAFVMNVTTTDQYLADVMLNEDNGHSFIFDGTMLKTIDGIDTDYSGEHGTFWEILDNETPAMYGAMELQLEDGHVYRIRMSTY